MLTEKQRSTQYHYEIMHTIRMIARANLTIFAGPASRICILAEQPTSSGINVRPYPCNVASTSCAQIGVRGL